MVDAEEEVRWSFWEDSETVLSEKELTTVAVEERRVAEVWR